MTDETLLQQGTGTCRKARSSDTGFNLGEAKRKLVALQNKVVSQHDGTTNLHDDRLEGKSLSDVLMVEIQQDWPEHADMWGAVALQWTRQLTDHMVQKILFVM